MKLKYYLSALLIAGAAMFASCVEDHTYEKGTADADDCWGVYFPSNQTNTVSGSVALTPDDPTTLEYVAKRMNIDGALDVPVTVTATYVDGDNKVVDASSLFKVSPLVFIDGEDAANFTIDFPESQVGVSYSFELHIDDPDNYYTSNYNSNPTYLKLALLRAKWIVCDEDKSIDWEFQGQTYNFPGYEWFTDDIATIFEDLATYPVRVEVRGDTIDEDYPYGPNGLAGLYRMVNPYEYSPFTLMYSDVYFEETNVEIDATNPNKVFIRPQRIGVSVDGFGDMTLYSMGDFRGQDYGKIENGAIVFPIKNSLLINFTEYNPESLYYGNPDGAFRLVIAQEFAVDYTLSVSNGDAHDGIIDLSVGFGKDVDKIRYAFYTGTLSDQAVASHAAAMVAGDEAYEELTDEGTLSVTLGATGVYTFVAALYNADGVVVGRASHSFGYVAAGDSMDVDLSIGLELTNKYKGNTTEDSAEFYGYGSDIEWAVWDIFTDKELKGASEEIIKNYLLALKDESAEAEVPYLNVLTAEQLSQLNGSGLAFIIPGLTSGTHYTVYMLAHNGYNTTLFSADITTDGVSPDLGPLDTEWTDEDLYTISKKELFGTTWIMYAIDPEDEDGLTDVRQPWVYITFSEYGKDGSDYNDGEYDYDFINIKGFGLGLTTNDTHQWEYMDGVILNYYNHNNIGRWNNYYINYIPYVGGLGSYSAFYDEILLGGIVDDGYMAMVYSGFYNLNGNPEPNGFQWNAYNDANCTNSAGYLARLYNIMFEDVAVSDLAKASAPMKKPTLTKASLNKLAQNMVVNNYVEIRGRERVRALIDEMNLRSNRTLKSSLKKGIIPVKADIPSHQVKAETTFTKGLHTDKSVKGRVEAKNLKPAMAIR